MSSTATGYDSRGRKIEIPLECFPPEARKEIAEIRREFGEQDEAAAPLVKLANGNTITTEQIEAWSVRAFLSGVTCGAAAMTAILVTVYAVAKVNGW